MENWIDNENKALEYTPNFDTFHFVYLLSLSLLIR